MNEDLQQEIKTFTAEEKLLCKAVYDAAIESGAEEYQAKRDAVAAILQKRRLSQPGPTERQRRDLDFWVGTYQKVYNDEDKTERTYSDEEAEQKAWQRVMTQKR